MCQQSAHLFHVALKVSFLAAQQDEENNRRDRAQKEDAQLSFRDDIIFYIEDPGEPAER